MRFAMSSSPHIRCSDNTRRIMLDVLIALLPTLLAGTIFFGLRCLLLAAVSIAAAGLAEALWNKLTRRYQTVEDLSAAVTGLLLALPELHKLGLLYQQGGQWQGKQLLDPNWVRESGRKQVENEEDGYGYLFWRGKYDSYRADGLYGQYSVILPAQEAVITCTAENRNQKQLLETLLDAIVPQL